MSVVTDECRARGHRTFAAVRASLAQDILRYMNKSPENRAAGDTLKTRLGAFFTPQILAMLLYRVSHWLYARGWRRTAGLVGRFNAIAHKVNISPRSCIGPGCHLPHPAGVTFDGTAGSGVTLYAQSICCPGEPSGGDDGRARPRLGDRVTVGGAAAVYGAVTVGHDTKVAPKVCLVRDAPPEVMVVSGIMRARYTPCRCPGDE